MTKDWRAAGFPYCNDIPNGGQNGGCRNAYPKGKTASHEAN